jgi:hypothetical protein
MTDFNLLNKKCANNIVNTLTVKKYNGHKISFINNQEALPNLIEIQKLVGDKFKHELVWTNMVDGKVCYRFELK